MFNPPALSLKDGYKVGHPFMFPKGTNKVYTNFTPRKGRVENLEGMVFFGLQAFMKNHLIDRWNETFFDQKKNTIYREHKRRIDNYLGKDAITLDHIMALHDLRYLPLKIKALKEGTLVPYRVPAFTITNTHKDFSWFVNDQETILSSELWQPSCSATTALQYYREFVKYARKTGASLDFVKWQGHDFSFRGMPGAWAAMASGAAHLLSFYGTDTIPAIDFLEEFYGANSDHELIGGSVPATEHAVMCVGGKEDELGTYARLLTETYPKGIVSIVSDTWDLWYVMANILPKLKGVIMARDGKCVIRPDSGVPEDILCGDPKGTTREARMGVIRLEYEIFGGTKNAAGFIEIDSHIGAIYGDSISPVRQKTILERLYSMGFASSSVVLGLGSYGYQFVTRDTHGVAMKATYAEVNGISHDIFKDPITDDGTKKSATGRLCVLDEGNGKLRLEEKCSKELEESGLLETCFLDGKITRFQTLKEIRSIVDSQV